MRHVWLDAGYRGEDKGGDWVEKNLSWSAEVVRHPPKPAPEKVLFEWARLWWSEEGREVGWQNLLPPHPWSCTGSRSRELSPCFLAWTFILER